MTIPASDYFDILKRHLEPFSGNLAGQLIDIELRKLDMDRSSFSYQSYHAQLEQNLSTALDAIAGPEMSSLTIEKVRSAVDTIKEE